jgi:hypothetical protein
MRRADRLLQTLVVIVTGVEWRVLYQKSRGKTLSGGIDKDKAVSGFLHFDVP